MFCLHICVYITCVPGVQGSQERDSLGPELQKVISHYEPKSSGRAANVHNHWATSGGLVALKFESYICSVQEHISSSLCCCEASWQVAQLTSDACSSCLSLLSWASLILCHGKLLRVFLNNFCFTLSPPPLAATQAEVISETSWARSWHFNLLFAPYLPCFY